ncbi:hypothetical protein G3N55_01450 [Dissulfurirhabdus thermomarina]|uniref:Uncharacterized protein n=1 Tax=Dissulfurirhabdus thermomarina TaxID=1765737 RepID=A0A6N9TKA0_DISTH|nr:hypothetical protein [Dissulfurirhabdus thermomarina]NDY41519.1 hypothetical protein [Dissulfurirhabdus thermomarina]NMX22962.1 hypothetical protein [Dissulfurirhabdus thermomarina]
MTLRLLVLANNFAHDFSAALWLSVAAVEALLLLEWRRSGPFDVPPPFRRILSRLRALFWWALSGVVVFGLVRLAAYRRFEWVDAAGGGQVVLLAAKHALFLALAVLVVRVHVLAGRILSRRGPAR